MDSAWVGIALYPAALPTTILPWPYSGHSDPCFLGPFTYMSLFGALPTVGWCPEWLKARTLLDR